MIILAIKVKEFRAFIGTVDGQINDFVKENKIKTIIDIKYSATSTGTFALLLYQE